MTVAMIDLLGKCGFTIDEMREITDFGEYVMKGLIEIYCQKKKPE